MDIFKIIVGIVIAIVLIGGFVFALRLNKKDTKDYGTYSPPYDPPL